jgi:hypothetical protein
VHTTQDYHLTKGFLSEMLVEVILKLRCFMHTGLGTCQNKLIKVQKGYSIEYYIQSSSNICM